jgi:ATPase subunit of ABC transporter with duplicated ATPase domains
VIVATAVQLRVGARLLLGETSLRISEGDRIGLVGRNGAGKTTLTKVLAGEALATSGSVTRTGAVGYLSQDPRTGDLEVLARDRILAARGLDVTLRELRAAETAMASSDGAVQERAMRKYTRLDAEFNAQGGYAAESEAASIASSLGLPDRVLGQPLRTLSGGQRRRVELSRILFSGAQTLLLDEPTNHLDADSIGWLRDYLKSYKGGLVIISHDVAMLDTVVNRVFHLDANRSEIDIYNVGWKPYLLQRETDERRRRRERLNAEKKASALLAQADKMRAKATKATAAQNMARRAERLLAGIEGSAPTTGWPSCASRAPHRAVGLPSLQRGSRAPTGPWRSSPTLTWPSIAARGWSCSGSTVPGKTTLLRILAGVDAPDTGEVLPGHGLKLGYYAQEHENLDVERTVLENMKTAAPDLGETEVRKVLGSFLFTGDDVDKPAKVLSGGEKTRLSLAMLVVSAANVLLLDEPTNNLDPASREEILGALRTYEGAVVLVTHDEGAVDALEPERVLLLPDGVEDLWGADYKDLVSLA